MRRIARHLFAIFSALSLLLCVATCVLWVRSRRVVSNITWSSRDGSHATENKITSAFGGITYGWKNDLYSDPLGVIRTDVNQVHSEPVELTERAFGYLGWSDDQFLAVFAGSSSSSMLSVRALPPGLYPDIGGFEISTRYWIVALTYALPAISVARIIKWWRRRALARRGYCSACGYDLRQSPERCPECGAANPRAAISAV